MTKAENPRNPDQMSFFEHLEELRGRILKSFIIWVVVFAACFVYSKDLFQIVAQPLIELTGKENPWAAVDFKEPFIAHLKAAFWVSFILSSGIFFYHFWAFVSPGLTKKEKRFARPFLFFMALFFLVGCWFSFTMVYPYALNYLIGWNEGNVDAYTRSSYLSLLFAFILGMGASFEMPLLIFFLAKLGLVTPKFLLDKFKYAVLLIFTLAAIITPTPDIYMQTFLAVPMLALYLLGVGLAWFVRKKDQQSQEKSEDLPSPAVAVDEES